MPIDSVCSILWPRLRNWVERKSKVFVGLLDIPRSFDLLPSMMYRKTLIRGIWLESCVITVNAMTTDTESEWKWPPLPHPELELSRMRSQPTHYIGDYFNFQRLKCFILTGTWAVLYLPRRSSQEYEGAKRLITGIWIESISFWCLWIWIFCINSEYFSHWWVNDSNYYNLGMNWVWRRKSMKKLLKWKPI